MPHEFKTLNSDDMDDTIIEFYHAQERDLHSHTINKERYEKMLEKLPNGTFRLRVEHLLEETESRILEVSSILEATESQLPKKEKLEAAVSRMAMRRNGNGS